MNRKWLIFLGSCAISPILADSDSPQQQSLWHYHPLHVGGQILALSKADCDNQKPNHRHNLGSVAFNKSNAFVSMMTPVSQHHIFFPQLQFNYVTFDWNKNDKFSQTHFYYAQFSLLYYTTALESWKWIMRFDYSLQLDHLTHPSQYSLYNGLLWGAYQIHPKWHYHIGALGYAGLKGYNIYPIFGVDYTFNKHWVIQAIFPINYSIEYKLAEWTLAIKGRPLKERMRTGPDEEQPRSIFSYSSMGTELNIQYEKQFKLALEGYAGYNWDGNFYIKNAHGKHAEYVNVKNAFYGGFSLNYGL